MGPHLDQQGPRPQVLVIVSAPIVDPLDQPGEAAVRLGLEAPGEGQVRPPEGILAPDHQPDLGHRFALDHLPVELGRRGVPVDVQQHQRVLRHEIQRRPPGAPVRPAVVGQVQGVGLHHPEAVLGQFPPQDVAHLVDPAAPLHAGGAVGGDVRLVVVGVVDADQPLAPRRRTNRRRVDYLLEEGAQGQGGGQGGGSRLRARAPPGQGIGCPGPGRSLPAQGGAPGIGRQARRRQTPGGEEAGRRRGGRQGQGAGSTGQGAVGGVEQGPGVGGAPRHPDDPVPPVGGVDPDVAHHHDPGGGQEEAARADLPQLHVGVEQLVTRRALVAGAQPGRGHHHPQGQGGQQPGGRHRRRRGLFGHRRRRRGTRPGPPPGRAPGQPLPGLADQLGQGDGPHPRQDHGVQHPAAAQVDPGTGDAPQAVGHRADQVDQEDAQGGGNEGGAAGAPRKVAEDGGHHHRRPQGVHQPPAPASGVAGQEPVAGVHGRGRPQGRHQGPPAFEGVVRRPEQVEGDGRRDQRPAQVYADPGPEGDLRQEGAGDHHAQERQGRRLGQPHAVEHPVGHAQQDQKGQPEEQRRRTSEQSPLHLLAAVGLPSPVAVTGRHRGRRHHGRHRPAPPAGVAGRPAGLQARPKAAGNQPFRPSAAGGGGASGSDAGSGDARLLQARLPVSMPRYR